MKDATKAPFAEGFFKIEPLLSKREIEALPVEDLQCHLADAVRDYLKSAKRILIDDRP